MDLGSFFDILRGGYSAKERELSISLEVTWEGKISSFQFFGRGKEERSHGTSAFETRLSFDDQKSLPISRSCTLLADGVRVAEVVNDGTSAHFTSPELPGLDGLEAHLSGLLPFVHSVRNPPKKGQANGLAALVDTVMSHYIGWNTFLESVEQIRPLRGPIPRYSVLGRTPTFGFGAEGEALLRALRNREPVERTNRTLIAAFNEWLADRLKIVKSMRLQTLDREAGIVASLVADEREGFDSINVANMGEGLSQILPVFSKVLGAGYDDCVIVQQPEIHLHPALQADLADLFIDSLRNGNVHQFIVETHSEHLLLRLRRRVAEGAIPPEKVSVLYVERQGDHSTVRSLKLGSDGHFDYWPEGFFEQDVEEAYQLAKATHKPRGE